ncbi:hypothetical protein EVAR_60709_1 [Eumeta japonica]|uniref:F-box domain-containing protein n=1 Tax=Eumeta variegata TaxID=151549 RepID=A0A4C1ZAR6_EUMVA|nr:hypothetical protein EVAR_60709_1 [Eumeta japonica]
MEGTSRKSWSLSDRRTDQEVLKEMGLGLLEPDDPESSADDTPMTNMIQAKAGLKRKHNIENVNPNISNTKARRSPSHSPRKRHIDAASPDTSHSKSSPKSFEKNTPRTLQPSNLNSQQESCETSNVYQSAIDDTLLPQHPVSEDHRKSVRERYQSSPSPDNLQEVSNPSTSSAVENTAQTLKKKHATADAFELVSDEVMLSIFKWLPKATLVTCMFVCKRWHRIASDETFWQRLELGNRSIARNAIGRILSRKPIIMRLAGSTIGEWNNTLNFTGEARLQYLDLGLCSISLNTLNALLERCVNLKKLSLENVPVDTDSCRYIGNCPKMETLNLTMATGFTPEGLTFILNGCKGLQSLNVSWCKFCAACIQVLVTAAPKCLQRLNLAGARHLDDEMVMSLVKSCPRLQELDLSDCPQLTEVSVKALSRLNSLEHLALSRCYQLQTMHMFHLNGMPALQFLDMFGMLLESSIITLKARMPGISINKYMLSAVARPTVGPRRTSVWGLRTRD